MITYVDLHTIDYKAAWDFQEEKLKEVYKVGKSGIKKEYILFCEHPHVYTLGKNGKKSNLLANHIQLQATNATFVKTNRGGDITYHGPGQIVGYPILNLAMRRMGVKSYIENLEDCMIRFLADLGINGQKHKNAVGIWLDVGTSKERKICAIGVRISRSVSMHGFALNVTTDLKYFSYIHPCGFVNKGITSIQQELGRKIDFSTVKEQLKKNVLTTFND